MIERKDMLGLVDAKPEEIREILDTAANMKKLLRQGIKKLPHLEGCTATILFYENSTRTRTSFELAAKYMGATTINIAASSSSVAKGETLVDTGKTLDAMKNDFIIIRHPMGGAPYLLARTVKASVLNAGDGMNEHPTQALLDLCTMREKFGKIEGLKVAILGDIKHSRVAKSDLFGLTKLGAEVRMFAPETLIPKGIDRLGAKLCASREEAVEGADVVIPAVHTAPHSAGTSGGGQLPFAQRICGVLRSQRKGALPRFSGRDRHAPRSRQPRRGAHERRHRR